MSPPELLLLYAALLTGYANASHVFNTTVCSTVLDDSLWEVMNENGSCEPYVDTAQSDQRYSPCDEYFTVGVDYVYIPNSLMGGSQSQLRDTIEKLGAGTGFLTRCKDSIEKVICFLYYLPCGSNGTYHVPEFFCPDVCNYITEKLCPKEWKDFIDGPNYAENVINTPDIQPLNCSDTDALINFLSLSEDCCNDDGFILPAVSSSLDVVVPTASGTTATFPYTIVIAIVVIVIICLMLICLVLGVILFRKRIFAKKKVQSYADLKQNQNQYTHEIGMKMNGPAFKHEQLISVPSSYFADLSDHMIDKCNIKLLELIGQGEFGMVYHAILIEKDEVPTAVAVKTLKGMFNENDLIGIFEESLKMKEFNHFNVLRLIGVFFDENEAPCIVMPYMSEGSLLSYLKRERSQFSTAEKASVNQELVDSITKQLLSMCLQVANGMEYLSRMKFVHRDLAARNCMVSTDGVIKVADFGLSEDVYMKSYFRMTTDTDPQKTQIKLPIKWMALESIHDGLFSEKTDVWSYGVLCWEVFTVGKNPYPGLSPKEVVDLLDSGQRMDKPKNMACTNAIFAFIMSCWSENPEHRKCFADIVLIINEFIKPLANYMDFTSFFSQRKPTESQ